MTDPVVIQPLSDLWLIGILVSLIISIIIVQVGIRIPPDKRRVLMVTLGTFILVLEVLQQFYYYHF